MHLFNSNGDLEREASTAYDESKDSIITISSPLQDTSEGHGVVGQIVLDLHSVEASGIGVGFAVFSLSQKPLGMLLIGAFFSDVERLFHHLVFQTESYH